MASPPSPHHPRTKVAIIGAGEIGTDLVVKLLRLSSTLDAAAMAGDDQACEGLTRARRFGVATTHEGIDGLLRMPEFEDVGIVFDATSAGAHRRHHDLLAGTGRTLIDLTSAAIGPYVVPPVNLEEHRGAFDVNMVTCGGQAAIPMVAAVSRVTPVHYAEIIASIASRSAGPGTRATVDEFTRTTSDAIERVGGAARGKAIIVLNPTEPPMIMRDTVYCLVGAVGEGAVRDSVAAMEQTVRGYVPGYRLKRTVQFDRVGPDDPLRSLAPDAIGELMKVGIFLEVEGAAPHLPAYAGNLDIMTSAALRTAERLAQMRLEAQFDTVKAATA